MSAENGIRSFFSRNRFRPGMVFALIIVVALMAFEMFNYTTTDYALRDLLGDLRFMGIGWATILAIAFCGIDFAGVARLFTPEKGSAEPKEVWYLFGAWFLAATMNAILTWWGVSMAVATHKVQSAAVIDPTTITRVVPIFVALMVWVIRILIIGTISVAGERMFVAPEARAYVPNRPRQQVPTSLGNPVHLGSNGSASRPIAARSIPSVEPSLRPDPTYHSIASGARPILRSAPVGDPSPSNNNVIRQ